MNGHELNRSSSYSVKNIMYGNKRRHKLDRFRLVGYRRIPKDTETCRARSQLPSNLQAPPPPPPAHLHNTEDHDAPPQSTRRAPHPPHCTGISISISQHSSLVKSSPFQPRQQQQQRGRPPICSTCGRPDARLSSSSPCCQYQPRRGGRKI